MWGCFCSFLRQSLWVCVFPTHVGVFLSTSKPCARALRLPHACGGVSITVRRSEYLLPSSPRMWGCFHHRAHGGYPASVFPTHVGVFPPHAAPTGFRRRLPHACGGVSHRCHRTSCRRSSSPRMWGCFGTGAITDMVDNVFPTHVGVFPPRGNHSRKRQGLPHACGGVSSRRSGSGTSQSSSPRMWGCFPLARLRKVGEQVFPTHVGVFLMCSCVGVFIACLPHACGGVSQVIQEGAPMFMVFPTHVGVFPFASPEEAIEARLPHACGGVSISGNILECPFTSSPRMWGCFLKKTLYRGC